MNRALGCLVMALVSSCTPGARSRVDGAARATPTPTPTSGGWSFEVTAGPGARELAVVATLAKGAGGELGVDEGADRFVRDVELEERGTWRAVAASEGSWTVPSCASSGCRLRYRFLLGEAAAAIDDFTVAEEHEGALLAPPSTWLLRPFEPPVGQPLALRVHTPPGVSFATGIFPAGGARGSFVADTSDVAELPYSLFGPLPTRSIEAVGATLELARVPGRLDATDDDVAAWVASAAANVSGYYGRFPIEHALVVVLPTGGEGLGYGRALGNGGGSIVAPLGRATRAAALEDDWVMTHEMIHLGFPTLARRHRWLEEGIATYVEPIARARRGTMPPEVAWGGLLRGLPNGLPAAGDRGLDDTPTWGRTYWGGALFCLLADVSIREATGNARSLDDALRAIAAAGGTIARRWDIERVIDVGDRATGTHVLRDLYARMARAPEAVDLRALEERLGVSLDRRTAIFDDGAPLAGVRRAITAAPP